MIFKNLLRRKGRTLLTVLGISIGVAAIIGLGALAEGLEAGYSSVMGGSQADLVLSDPDAFDIIMSAIDETVGDELRAMPEVEAVSGMMQGLVQTEGTPYFFVFAYDEGSFVLSRFNIVEGHALDSREAHAVRGRPILLGSASAESLKKGVGDTIRLGEQVYRIVGIYETGEAFEEGGAVLRLEDAQALLGLPRQVSAFYIQLRDPALADRLRARVERLYPRLSLSTTEEMAGRSELTASVQAMVWGVAALAILIGGISMMNSQLMAVLERTREIGVLRAVGWRSWRVLLMILGESVAVGLLGGLLGTALGWGMLRLFSSQLSAFGSTGDVSPVLLAQAFGVVFTLGLVGGLYPAYRASRLQPIEALRYEGGTLGQRAARLPFGGLAVQNLWRRKARTFLTLGVIGITVGAIMALNALLDGSLDLLTDFVGGSEVVVRQAGAADTSVAFIDQQIGARIAAMPEVKAVSGVLFTATMSQEQGVFVITGYNPREPAIRNYNIVEGERISTNRQIMVGRQIAEAQNIRVGDTITLGETRFRVVGIYEHSVAVYEMGGVITLRDAQTFTGRQRKVTFFFVDLHNPNQAEAVAARINAEHPDVHATLAGQFAEQLPDLEATRAMSDGIAFMAILVGGVGVMNTMLMAVLERTREIGTLRALGWRQRAILGLILRESLALGLLGGLAGVAVAWMIVGLTRLIPTYGEVLVFTWQTKTFTTSAIMALALGAVGGLYPALRATRMQPVEALRYE